MKKKTVKKSPAPRTPKLAGALAFVCVALLGGCAGQTAPVQELPTVAQCTSGKDVTIVDAPAADEFSWCREVPVQDLPLNVGCREWCCFQGQEPGAK